MSRLDWLSGYLARLADRGAAPRLEPVQTLGPRVRRVTLPPSDWGTAAEVAAALGWRWAGVWGDPFPETCVVRACLQAPEGFVVLETETALEDASLASHTRYYQGANRLERHLRDLIGVGFHGHPQDHRWTRHQAWGEDEHPLRTDFPVAGRNPKRAPADTGYPFVRVQGGAVYEIPVGPIHAGIIEPGHFRFQAVGEEILRLEERLGYLHKGIEKIAVGRAPEDLARLAGRVSGDTTVGHAWAACQAMERAAHCAVPPRALHLRALLAERERIANHLGDIGAICNDVGFSFPHMQCSGLREQWQRRNRALFGHRLLMDTVTPGGIARDLPAGAVSTLSGDHRTLREALAPVFDIVGDHPSLDDRLLSAGILSQSDARMLGCTGFVGKASGQDLDLRRDHPYPPYDRLDVNVPALDQGDIAARVQVRMQEVRISLDLMDRLLDTLPDGEVSAALPEPPAGADGLGLVEGWRGDILCYLRFGADGRIARYFPRDPSWFQWPALERLIHGNIVPDFPVCNKSVNGSYSGHDL
ncbi:hydrogenase large subunit [Thioalkalivibrio thiocyanodenitrificans]|uniref:hydrogenase large subunit n=1 Tax=Thioalkalivibrio thiocyanodenitrificans TaxID=243063 RepID=UPI0003656876|nr:NADH-quinone oxidoreductase subunit C [Thioalkalivibrio thiocyanodenitrificans]